MGQSEKDGVNSGAEALRALEQSLRDCRGCGLCSGRTQVVFGVGDPDADLMFVGEGPGFHEDKQGEPFVGAAGKLLTELLGDIGLGRADVYIANVVKCRPPENRDPAPDEIEACSPHLMEQIGIIRPRVICTLGRFATKLLAETELSMTAIHGKAKQREIAGVECHRLPGLPSRGRAVHPREPPGACSRTSRSCVTCSLMAWKRWSPDAAEAMMRVPAARVLRIRRSRAVPGAVAGSRLPAGWSNCLCGRRDHVVLSRGGVGLGELRRIGRRLAGALRGGDLVLLYGPLGAGKTTLVRAIAEALEVTDPVRSPSFTLANIYSGTTARPASRSVPAGGRSTMTMRSR